MANFYFPQAFSANPIQSFIDGKLDAMKRVEEQRRYNVDLWYKYQNYLMSKERHNASLAATKQRSAALDYQQKLYDSLSKGTGYDDYFKGGPSSAGGEAPIDNRRMINVRGAFQSNPNYGQPLAVPSGRAQFEAKFGKPMGLGGPRPNSETDPGFDEFGMPLGSTPFDMPNAGNTTGNNIPRNAGADPRIGPDGEFLPQFRGQALDAGQSFGHNPFDRTTANYIAQANARQPNGPNAPAPRVRAQADPFAAYAPEYTPDDSSGRSRTPRRYDPLNTAGDEMWLAYLGGRY